LYQCEAFFVNLTSYHKELLINNTTVDILKLALHVNVVKYTRASGTGGAAGHRPSKIKVEGYAAPPPTSPPKKKSDNIQNVELHI
jgi:hypothetical protein